MRRIDFISGNASSDSDIKSPSKKPEKFDGTFYCAMGYLPSGQVFRGYKSAVVLHRKVGQRKDRKVAIAPLSYKSKEEVLQALNNMIDHIKKSGI